MRDQGTRGARAIRRRFAAIALSGFVASGAGRAAAAGEGVVEINAARAAAGGVTPPDTPGFPITISAAGSYRLTGNLVQPDPQVDVIEITSEGVTIDLGGFAITGSVVCVGTTVTACVPNNPAGRAIDGSATQRTAVRNGSVRGTGQGVVLGSNCLVEDVRVTEVGSNGIACGARGSIVRGSSVLRTGSTGIAVANGGVIEHSTSANNAGSGIRLTGPGIVSDSTSSGNGSVGISTSVGATVTHCTASNNGGPGFDADSGSTIAQSTSYQNAGDGFRVGGPSTVLGSTAIFNSGLGLNDHTGGSGYGQNVFNANNGSAEAQVSGSPLFELGTNVCQFDTTCP